MPAFNPTTKYDIVQKDFPIRDFNEYADEFVTRPPYQRKNVWSRRKKQGLLDSLFRRFYVPRIVIREVRLSDEKTVSEIIDGQQRITTAQEFLSDELRLPKTLDDVHPELPGSRYSELPSEIRRFIDREMIYTADVVKGINDPEDPDHQETATEIFWRLQEGETLNYMEKAHSRLSSLVRNFVVKYADDQTFDFDDYEPVDSNPDKHPFFQVIDRNNKRMEHLALLTRFLILEEAGGPTDIKESNVIDYVEQYQREDGIGDLTLEEEPHAQSVLHTLRVFYEAFEDDPMVTDGDGLKEFKTEYFTISMFLLLRHLLKYYVVDEAERELFREFVLYFHGRWKGENRDEDQDILLFRDSRQQSGNEIAVRDRIVRQTFFQFAQEQGHELLTKDERRSFSEAERIAIYRRHHGLCQACLEKGLPEKEALVPWEEYEADHVVPHAKGGRTVIENGQVLCRACNKEKGASI